MKLKLLIILLIGVVHCFALNATDHLAKERLDRQKRFLTFSGGAFRCVAGALSGILFRSISPQWQGGLQIFTFSSGWALPSAPFYWWNQFPFQNVQRSFAEQQSRSLELYNRKLIEKPVIEDNSRKQVYEFLAFALTSHEADGKECIYRAICTTVNHPLKHNGVIGEIWDSVFTPKGGQISNDYVDAMDAGRAGVDCIKLYQKCPLGFGVLEKHAHFFDM